VNERETLVPKGRKDSAWGFNPRLDPEGAEDEMFLGHDNCRTDSARWPPFCRPFRAERLFGFDTWG
jgi:hypothetical protein